MAELVVWGVVLGIAITIAGIWMLSGKIERHMRDTAEIIVSSNRLILEEMRRLAGAAAQPAEPTVGVILERRCGSRRARAVPAGDRPGMMEQRRSPGRRREDLKVVG